MIFAHVIEPVRKRATKTTYTIAIELSSTYLGAKRTLCSYFSSSSSLSSFSPFGSSCSSPFFLLFFFALRALVFLICSCATRFHIFIYLFIYSLFRVVWCVVDVVDVFLADAASVLVGILVAAS